ncbi:MAG: UbiD family decarboxylase [Acidobacteria bacterium]|nr:UbiD family decarboxylase [Acidobacteriota bacterium]
MQTIAKMEQVQAKAFSLRSYLETLESLYPEEIVRVSKTVRPAEYEVTAILKHLEDRSRFPVVFFENPLNLKGKPSPVPLVSNLYATRERCALALGTDPADCQLGLSLEYARRVEEPVPPVAIQRSEAPVKEVVKTGDEVDLAEYPIVRHHEMDPAPYVNMTPVMKDPDGGFYNSAFLRNMYKGPRKLGIHMSPRHNWQIHRKYEERGRPTPTAIIVSHHPAFYLGCLNVAPFGLDDYAVIGGIMGQPLRLTPSETLGEEFLVPADADFIIEGFVVPKAREVEAPFGEFTGYYGPQRLRPVIEVTAVTHRKDAIFQHTFVGHRDNWVMGGLPKEGAVYNVIRGVIPTVKSVHFALSGSCRFNCYISIDKKVEGEPKQAALAALGAVDFIKNVIVVDSDINVYNEQEVMFAVATRVQADRDIEFIKNVKGNTLDPSQLDDITTTKMLVDATRPVNRAFPERVRVPQEVLDRLRLEDYIPAKKLEKLPVFSDSVRSV